MAKSIVTDDSDVRSTKSELLPKNSTTEQWKLPLPTRWQTSLPTRYQKYRNSWYPEAAAMFLSLSCALIIATILFRFDGQPAPGLSFGLTLNTIVSILATTSKAALLFCVSNSLAQFKWIWFTGNRDRSLLDIEVLDEASRGPLGATKLLTSRMTSPLASLGSLLTILALLFDPFTQQLIIYHTEVHHTNSGAGAASLQQARACIVDPNAPAFKQALNTAFSNGGQMNSTCPSGSCTWQNITTVGWCAQCATDNTWSLSSDCSIDVSIQELAYESRSFQTSCSAVSPSGVNVSLATVVTLMTQSDSANGTGSKFTRTVTVKHPVYQTAILRSMGNLSETTYDLQPDDPVIRFSTLSASYILKNGQLHPNLTVQTCSLDLCLQKYNVDVINGTTRISGLHTVSGLKSNFTNPYESEAYICWSPEPGLPTMSNAVLGTDWSYVYFDFEHFFTCVLNKPVLNLFEGWANSLAAILRGNSMGGNSWDANGISSVTENITFEQTLKDEIGIPSNSHIELMRIIGIEQLAENLAYSLSNLTLDPTANYGAIPTLVGETGRVVNKVVVRWVWLTLPLILSIGGCIFLYIMIFLTATSPAPLWKSSVNAFFFHGLDHDIGIHSSLTSISDMEKQSFRTKARLVPMGLDKRLRLETTVIREDPFPD